MFVNHAESSMNAQWRQDTCIRVDVLKATCRLTSLPSAADSWRQFDAHSVRASCVLQKLLEMASAAAMYKPLSTSECACDRRG